MKSKILTFISVLILSISTVFAENSINNQQVRWQLDDQGVLVIKKNSVMQDYTGTSWVSKAPWNDFRNRIKEIIIEEGVTDIGASAFLGCQNLTTITLPKTIKTIGERAFYNCNKLESAVIPNSVTLIGAEAFCKCTSLRLVNLPNGLKEIPRGMFCGCTNLKTAKIPDSVTTIGISAFEECSNLSNVTIPKNVILIGERAFFGCANITEVVIPDGVSVIEKETFYNCTFLEKVTIGTSVKKINSSAFGRCLRLVDVYANSSSVPQVEGNPFGSKNKKMYLWLPANRVRNYEIDKYWKNFSLRSVGRQTEYIEEPKITTTKPSSKNTTVTAPNNRQTAYVVTASPKLNVRSAASTQSAIIGTLHLGDVIYVEKIENGSWGKIKLNGKTGYVSTKYIKEATTLATQNVAQSTTSSTHESTPPAETSARTNSRTVGNTKMPSFAPIRDNGNGTYTMGETTFDGDELITYFEKYCPAAYNEFQHSRKISRRCNASWFTLGLVGTGLLVGGGCAIGKDPVAGYACLGIGSGCAVACIPLVIVGVLKEKNAVSNGLEVYNVQCTRRYYSHQRTPVLFQLTTSGNGLGVTINF